MKWGTIICVLMLLSLESAYAYDKDCLMLAEDADGSSLRKNLLLGESFVVDFEIYQTNYGPPSVEVNDEVILDLTFKNIGINELSNITFSLLIVDKESKLVGGVENLEISKLIKNEEYHYVSKPFKINKPGLHSIILPWGVKYQEGDCGSCIQQLNSAVITKFQVEPKNETRCISFKNINLEVDKTINNLKISFLGSGCFSVLEVDYYGQLIPVITPYHIYFPYPQEVFQNGSIVYYTKRLIPNKDRPDLTYIRGTDNQSYETQILFPEHERTYTDFIAMPDEMLWKVEGYSFYSPKIFLPKNFNKCKDKLNRVVLKEVEADAYYYGDVFYNKQFFYPFDSYGFDFSLIFDEDYFFASQFVYNGNKWLKARKLTTFNHTKLIENGTYEKIKNYKPYWEDVSLIKWAGWNMLTKDVALNHYVEVQSFSNFLVPLSIFLILVGALIVYSQGIVKILKGLKPWIDIKIAINSILFTLLSYLFQILFYSPPLYAENYKLTLLDIIFIINLILCLVFVIFYIRNRKTLKENNGKTLPFWFKTFLKILFIILFFLILGKITHELGHLLFLLLFKCKATFSLHFLFKNWTLLLESCSSILEHFYFDFYYAFGFLISLIPLFLIFLFRKKIKTKNGVIIIISIIYLIYSIYLAWVDIGHFIKFLIELFKYFWAVLISFF